MHFIHELQKLNKAFTFAFDKYSINCIILYTAQSVITLNYLFYISGLHTYYTSLNGTFGFERLFTHIHTHTILNTEYFWFSLLHILVCTYLWFWVITLNHIRIQLKPFLKQSSQKLAKETQSTIYKERPLHWNVFWIFGLISLELLGWRYLSLWKCWQWCLLVNWIHSFKQKRSECLLSSFLDLFTDKVKN